MFAVCVEPLLFAKLVSGHLGKSLLQLLCDGLELLLLGHKLILQPVNLVEYDLV
jgi:hypothetical protein